MEYEDPTLFEGIRFYLAGFNSPFHHQVKTKIVSCGGVYVANYSSDCTHVIVYNLLLDDPICVAARRDGKALVTDSWISHSLEAGILADTLSVMYRPVKDLNGIPGANELVISLTGFHGGRRSDIMTMVDLMGAEYAKSMAPLRATHLLCYKFEGEKYEKAKMFPAIKIVNHQWLEDCLKAWKILPEEQYNKSSYELEMMEVLALDSEEETEDNTTRLIDRRVMNGFADVHNVRNNGAKLPSEREKAADSEICHKMDKHMPVKLKSDQPNVMKMPSKSDRAELGNPSRPSSKRSANSLGPSKSRGNAKRSDVSAKKSGSSDKKTIEHLKSKDDEVTIASASFGGSNSKGASEIHSVDYSPSTSEAKLVTPEEKLHHIAEKENVKVGGCNLVSNSKISAVEGLTSTTTVASDVSPVVPKFQKLNATGSKRTIASEPLISVSSPLKKSKNSSLGVSNRTGTGTVRASKDKSSLAFEKLQQAGQSNNTNTRPTLTSGNAISCATSNVQNKEAPEIASFSPENRKSEALKSGNLMFTSDGRAGGSDSKTPRKKSVARKTLGSRPKVNKKTSDAKKCSLSGKHSNEDAIQIDGMDRANPSVADKVTTVHAHGGSNALESRPVQDFAVDIDDYAAAPFNEVSKGLPEFVIHQNNANESSCVTKARARAASGTLHCETDEAEMTSSPSAHTYNQEMEHVKQNSAQKKTVISVPKEVAKEADDNVGGKASENKESGKRQAVSAVGKKRHKGQLVKKTGQVEDEPVASDDLDAYNSDKRFGSFGLKMRRATLSLRKSDTPVNIESVDDKNDGDYDVVKQPEKVSGTSNSTEVMAGIENEHGSFAANGRSTKKGVKRTVKKGSGNQLVNHISSEKENLPSLRGKLGKSSVTSNNSIVGNNQSTIQGKKIVGKKRRETPVLNKSERLVETENENEPIIHDGDVRSKGESLKSNLTVRGSNVISSDPSTIQSGLTVLKSEPTRFLVSGHRLQRKEFHQFIKRLNGRHCRDSHQWTYQATHFIVPDPIRRTEKFFAAAASGRWILKTDYLTESIQAGKFLPEEPYEWHKSGLTEDGAINLEAPRKWRLQREKTGHGAFHGMRIVVYGECIVPPLDTLKRAVKAGDGIILATSPPYTRFLNSGVDYAVVSPGIPRVDMWVQEFLRHEIPCVSADYLVEYVCKPGYPLDRHVHYNTHEWAAKSFDRLSSLSIESVSDAATPDDQLTHDNLDLVCQVCGCSDREDVMLICGDESGSTGCGVGMHIDCCNPPLDNIPDDDWFCPDCMQSKTKPLPNTKK